MEKIDRKFKIIAVNPCKPGTKFLLGMITMLQVLSKIFKFNACTDQDCFLFKAKDVYAVDALDGYSQAMEEGCKGDVNIAQRTSARYVRIRVARYQLEHGSSVPGIETSCEVGRCIDGEGV